MKAVLLKDFGDTDVMYIGDTPDPEIGPDQVLIKVAATSVNGPDLIQRQGRYPPPPGESQILGLEVAGTIEAVGRRLSDDLRGQRVMALIAGGGYAEYAAAYASHVIPIPENLSYEQAACVPETYITAYQNLVLNAGLRDGESVLLHGGGGGVNTAAIQICKSLMPGGIVIVTVSPGKQDRVKALGADHTIDYQNEDFGSRVLEITDGRGVDVILDHIGAEYLERNLKSLAIGGRLAIIAATRGREATLNLGRLMVKRHTIIGSVLRPRPIAEKAAIIAKFREHVMPRLADGTIAPVIHQVLPLEKAAEAHATMEASRHFGKIVLSTRAAEG